ncbi:MAG: hypothetical protein ACK5P3_16420, partial [Dolichospermum sp.]
MQAKEIKDKLNLLIEQASEIDPSLMTKLRAINRWIKQIKLGSWMSNPIVVAFLLEVMTDSRVWLAIRA